jgi:2-oxoglutarate ferredoxin oxidoreductase subunit delta
MAVMTVDFERCKGCSLCAAFCPKHIVEIQKEKRNRKGYFTAACADPPACVGCALCAVMCPDCAIMVEK